MNSSKRRNIYRKGAADVLKSAIVPILFTFAVVGMIALGLRQTGESSKSEGLRVLEESITRATVKCYAIEGMYPDTIAYIERNYGIRIDRSKYLVHYEVIATNLFPVIMVTELVRD